MARKKKLIKPINNARFEDVARALLTPKKKPTAQKTPAKNTPKPKKEN